MENRDQLVQAGRMVIVTRITTFYNPDELKSISKYAEYVQVLFFAPLIHHITTYWYKSMKSMDGRNVTVTE